GDQEARRRRQRAAYVPLQITNSDSVRREVSLDGTWLFCPDYELPPGVDPVATDYDDQSWHTLAVPAFWTPGLSWLHGETGFNGLGEFARTKGVAESLYVQEVRRCNAYTFDWRRTSSAWYRQYLELPDKLGDHDYTLHFDAIAKQADIWLNGERVSRHTGMFGPVNVPVTSILRPGRNLLAVHVVGDGKRATNQVEGVAVTVEVTSSMLRSLPHGMYQDETSGIWQPVSLQVAARTRVAECFIKPGLHDATIDLQLVNTGQAAVDLTLDYAITAETDGSVLHTNVTQTRLQIPAGHTNRLTLSVNDINPRLWTPATPDLYRLQIWLRQGGQLVDHTTERFGFRTFTVSGSQFLLNGRPYWLRGANPFPNTLCPNDQQLAHHFMQLARDGNIAVTRSHIVPFTKTWLDAADEVGMGVSFEGTWPWLMLSGEPPTPELLAVWKAEFLDLMQLHQNHPSLLLWTVNNEMKFPILETNQTWLRQKWLVLDDLMKAMRRADPTRPIVADSSYVRKEAARSYQSVVLPLGLDDGDVDDRHAYFGWYEPSFFHFNRGELGAASATPGRPLISQELSTGYPNNDDGHATRFYLFKNYTPQALVGEAAYESADPAAFQERQAFMTKELAETLRRTERSTMAGVLHFSYFTWFQTPWSTAKILPQPGYYALKTALQPVLVSAELFGRHFYAGDTLTRRVCLINDSEAGAALPPANLTWEIKAGNQILATGRQATPAVPYYQNQWLELTLPLPGRLPGGRQDAELNLRLEQGDKIIATNQYAIVLAERTWATP
ncbi:MAG TPA: glycoside hydrolase family 2 TIM barrel-domain containing protein, partial [Verrucomicrobiae bacterium]